MNTGKNRSIQRVLVVDDERDIRTVADMSLSTIAGWHTRLASHGDEAISIAAQENFDVVLLDMMMPGRDGLSTLRALRELPGWEKTPVIMVTAKAQRHEIMSYIDAGAAGVITKPFDPMTLPQRVTELAERASDRPGASKPDLQTKLAALRAKYVGKLPAKLEEIRSGLGAWKDAGDEASYHAVRTPVHKLHGTAGSYGLAAVSKAAGALEELIVQTGPAATPSEADFDPALARLTKEIAQASA